MVTDRLKIELSVPNFFHIPLKKIEIDAPANTGRTYFIYRGEIVAVARRVEEVGNAAGPH